MSSDALSKLKVGGFYTWSEQRIQYLGLGRDLDGSYLPEFLVLATGKKRLFRYEGMSKQIDELAAPVYDDRSKVKDLLEALENLVLHQEALGRQNTIIDEARATIARAKGEQP